MLTLESLSARLEEAFKLLSDMRKEVADLIAHKAKHAEELEDHDVRLNEHDELFAIMERRLTATENMCVKVSANIERMVDTAMVMGRTAERTERKQEEFVKELELTLRAIRDHVQKTVTL